MEKLVTDPRFWAGKSVFLTGHTGFKGSWLSLWLKRLGAKVHGYALAPPTSPNLFDVADVGSQLGSHTIGDVRDTRHVERTMRAAQPDVVLHLAAQPLVRYSYAEPVETFAVNVMGTVHVLEAARQLGTVLALVNVTTDKCYDNKEWHGCYAEDDPLGGRDPYSSSKACSELVTAAYRSSFHASGAPWIATARAGNVIGGGDWALDRLLPDVFRALDSGQDLTIRYPDAVRPWQHVLEPLSGYLQLAERLTARGNEFAKAWNFGPDDQDAQTVGWILDRIQTRCPKLHWQVGDEPPVHEATFLKLHSGQARRELDWQPRWSLETALDKTVAWHEAWRGGADMSDVCSKQIADYEAAALNG